MGCAPARADPGGRIGTARLSRRWRKTERNWSRGRPRSHRGDAASLPEGALGSLRNEKDRGERRQRETQLAMLAAIDCLNRSGVPDVAAAVDRGIGIEHLLPKTGDRHLDPVVASHFGREIDRYQAARAQVAPLAQPDEDAALGVVGNDPLE